MFGWELGWPRWLADEAFRVGGVRGIEHAGPLLAGDFGGAVVDVGGRVKCQPGVAMLIVVPGKKYWQCTRAASIEVNRPGKSGRYFSVLNCASLNGLSLETCGRECDWVMPRSASGMPLVWRSSMSRGRRGWSTGHGQLSAWRRSGGQHLGQRGGFAAGDHPADDVAGIDVQDHVQVVVGPFRWAEQLRYVPRHT